MEYVSQKTVTILERRLGLMHLFFFVLIMGYMVGVRLVMEKGYQAVEISHGFVSATLEGNTYSKGNGQAYAVDMPELIGPQLESNALFVPTTVATTRRQVQDNCTDPEQPCNADADCMRQPPLAYGLCEDGRCVQLGWCPRENFDVTQVTVLQNLRDLNVILAADMHFPRLGSERMSTEDGRNARTSWPLASLIKRAGVPYATAVSDGLVLSCVLEWACDLNPGAAPCVPRLRVYPLAVNASFSAQWATYYQVRGSMRAGLAPRPRSCSPHVRTLPKLTLTCAPTYRQVRDGPETEQHRDLHNATGLRLLFTSRGTGRRVDLYACVLQLFMILALVPIAGTIADTIMTNVFAERRHYQEYKNEMTPDFSDVRAKVEQLEQQTQATQQKMLDYGED
jgi:hypothetical protein